MTITTLTPPRNPDIGSGQDVEYIAEEVQFGDGYAQDSAFGINPKKSMVHLVWSGLTEAEKNALVDFFDDRAGWQYFYYTLPTESTARIWVCKKVSESWDEVLNYTVSVSFKERFVFVGV